MTKRCASAAVLAALMAGFASPALGLGEGELLGLAQAHWAAIAAGDLDSLATEYAPGAEFALWGTAGRGRLTAPQALSFWASLAGSLGEYQALRLRLLPETATVVAQLSFPRPEGELAAISALSLDGEGRIAAEDFVVLGQGFALDGVLADGEYANVLYDKSTDMQLQLVVGAVLLYVGLRSPGRGWLAVGFGPQRGMAGANIIIAAVSGEELRIEDHYGSSRTSHRRDEVDHMLFAAGREDEAGTGVEFVIPLDSGDPQDVSLVRGETYPVILAYHRSSDSFSTRHFRRNTLEIVME